MTTDAGFAETGPGGQGAFDATDVVTPPRNAPLAIHPACGIALPSDWITLGAPRLRPDPRCGSCNGGRAVAGICGDCGDLRGLRGLRGFAAIAAIAAIAPPRPRPYGENAGPQSLPLTGWRALAVAVVGALCA